MTPEKNSKFIILNTRKFKSGDRKDDGAIRRIQIQTPQAQVRLISLEDLRRTILTISGILKKGRIIPVIKPILLKRASINLSFMRMNKL